MLCGKPGSPKQDAWMAEGAPGLRVLMVVTEMGILLLVVKEGLGEKDRHLFVGG
mgnify:CR=1 FL=1